MNNAKAKTFYGEVCQNHPHLKGKRYTGLVTMCVGCRSDLYTDMARLSQGGAPPPGPSSKEEVPQAVM